MPTKRVSPLARFGGFPPRAGACRPGGGPFLQRHGKPSSRARRSYSARTASLHRSSIARSLESDSQMLNDGDALQGRPTNHGSLTDR